MKVGRDYFRWAWLCRAGPSVLHLGKSKESVKRTRLSWIVRFEMYREVLFAIVLSFGSCLTSFGQIDWTNAYVSYFPHSPVGGGTEYVDGFRLKNGWEVGLIVQNPYDGFTNVRYDFYDGTGQQTTMNLQAAFSTSLTLAYGFTSSVDGHSSRETILSLPSETVQARYIKVTIPRIPSGQPFAGRPSANVILHFRNKVNGNVVGQAPVTAMAPSATFSFFAKRFSSVSQDKSETAIALVNPNDTSASVTVTRRNVVGEIRDVFTVLIPAKNNLARFLTELRSIEADYQGLIEISSTVPIVGIALQTSGDGGNFTFTTIDVITPPQ
jgi:hypothetical protein